MATQWCLKKCRADKELDGDYISQDTGFRSLLTVVFLTLL